MTIDIIMVHPFFSFFLVQGFFKKILGSFCSHLQKGNFFKKENYIYIYIIHFKKNCKWGKILFSFFFFFNFEIWTNPSLANLILLSSSGQTTLCYILQFIILPTHPPTPPSSKQGLNFPIKYGFRAIAQTKQVNRF